MNILRFLCTSGHSRTWIGAWMRMMLRALWKLGDGLGPGDFWPRSVEHTCRGDGRIVPPDPWQSVGTTRRVIVMLCSYVLKIWQTTRILRSISCSGILHDMVRSFSHCRAKSDAATHLLNLRAVLPKFNVCGVTLCLFPVECVFRDAHGFRVCWLTYFRKCFGSWFSQGRCFNILFRMCGRWRRLWRSVMKVSSWRCVSKPLTVTSGRRQSFARRVCL